MSEIYVGGTKVSVVLKIVLSDFCNESRDKREIACLVDQGHCVIVMAKSPINKYQIIEQDGYEVHFLPVDTKKSNGRRSIFKTAWTIFKWVKYARNIEPDCISGHDLIPLSIGYLSTLVMREKNRPILVYDSHELEMARKTKQPRNLIKLKLIMIIEKFLIKRSAFTIVVNDSIAEVLVKTYKLDKKPIVIRNIPKKWQINPIQCKQKRAEFCKLLSVPQDTFLLMFHGGISKGRGIVQIIQALTELERVAFIILGYGEDKEYYVVCTHELGVADKVLFLDAVPFDDLWKFIGAVDLSICIIENVCESYYLSLPNKLFEAIQSETPVIGSNFPEIAGIINDYGVGVTCNPNDVREIIEKIRYLQNNREILSLYKDNAKNAKEELCFEEEKSKLTQEYAKYLVKDKATGQCIHA